MRSTDLDFNFFIFLGSLLFLLPLCLSSHGHCLDSTCGLPFDPHLDINSRCTENDIDYTYTACNNDSTTTRMYFWKPPALCDSRNFSLPQPVSDLPCELLNCGKGNYVSLTKKRCEPCKAGTFNDGYSGIRWESWQMWPFQFVTYCAHLPGANCSPWKITEESISSGDNYDNHYLNNYLSFSLVLVTPGTLSFSYKVSAQWGSDGLLFTSNGVLFFGTSDTHGLWVDYTVDLSPGFHRVEWSYTKDKSISGGADKAWIRRLEVTGLKRPHDCKVCPDGTYSLDGATSCLPCSSSSDNPRCQKCTSEQYSLLGGTCLPLLPCEETDYVEVKSECLNNQRQISYVWIQPQGYCDQSSKQLPSPRTEPCDPEQCPGGYRRTGEGECEECPEGKYRPSEGGPPDCVTCPVGQATNLKHYLLPHFNLLHLPERFSTGCRPLDLQSLANNCFSQGWRSASTFLDSGSGHGSDVVSWLSYDFTMKLEGYISFNTSMMCKEGDKLVFTVDGVERFGERCINSASHCSRKGHDVFSLGSVKQHQITLSPGHHIVSWSFVKRSPPSPNCDRAMISGLMVVGGEQGGSTGCFTCPPNTYDVESECAACPSGTSSPANSKECTACPPNTFSAQPGTGCSRCGLNTYSPRGSTTCFFSCSNLTLLLPSSNHYRTWNLSLIDQQLDGPLRYPDVDGEFYMSVCSKRPLCNENVTHVCRLQKAITQVSTDLGSLISFNSNSAGDLLIDFSEGSLGCSARLRLQCDVGSAHSKPILVSSLNSTDDGDVSCNFEFKWLTQLACSVCQLSDFNYTLGPCRRGKQEKIYYLSPESVGKCIPRWTPPRHTFVHCMEVSFSKGEITGIVTGTVVGVFLLVISGVMSYVMYSKNRDLQAKYSVLVDQQSNDFELHSKADQFFDDEEDQSGVPPAHPDNTGDAKRSFVVNMEDVDFDESQQL
eukprot:TRINITY_DN10121_c0_g1_i1.p1 TRINITY_DN10121_c0_g1~~TRINITY_DN10121_c0_g1_i1.p1  ORF type:complete len:939 (+),score=66.86 TRINITY_DN10121_c0_g1_i1:36-2852(+)